MVLGFAHNIVVIMAGNAILTDTAVVDCNRSPIVTGIIMADAAVGGRRQMIVRFARCHGIVMTTEAQFLCRFPVHKFEVVICGIYMALITG